MQRIPPSAKPDPVGDGGNPNDSEIREAPSRMGVLTSSQATIILATLEKTSSLHRREKNPRSSCRKSRALRFSMKPSAQKNKSASRAAVKNASRQADLQRLALGESPEVIQKENSIFPVGYFENNRILNFASSIGK
jgi:hypothetical protein